MFSDDKPYIHNLQLIKHCNAITSEDKFQRKKGLEAVWNHLKENPNDLQDINQIKAVYKHILKCFYDQSDICRELSAKICLDLLDHINKDNPLLQFLVPILRQRFGNPDRIESSEEIRLLGVEILSKLVQVYSPLPSPYFPDIVAILTRALADTFPKVRKESCECAMTLAKTPIPEFQNHVSPLIKALITCFSHKHSKIREAAILATGEVVRRGTAADIEPVFGPLGEALFDSVSVVRQAVARVIGIWMLHFHDRYTWWYRLVPLMLTCLSDEAPECRRDAEDLWIQVGRQYYEENEEDLKDKYNFMTPDLKHYPTQQTRPNLGCRELVQRQLFKLIPMMAVELDDWLPAVRTKTAQLVCIVAIHAEEGMTHHIEKLLPALFRAALDEQPSIRDAVEHAAWITGHFIKSDLICTLVLPTMEDVTSAGHVRILCGLLRGSDPALLENAIPKIVTFLRSPHSLHQREALYQSQLLRCAAAILETCPKSISQVSFEMFVIGVSISGLAAQQAIISQSEGYLESFAGVEFPEMSPTEATAALYERHTMQLLQELMIGAESWTVQTPERFIFEALFANCGSSFGSHLEAFVQMLSLASSEEREPEIRLKIFIILASILQHRDHTLKLSVNPEPALIRLIQDVLLPSLIWKAGRSAEAIRTAAITCLYTALKEPDPKKGEGESYRDIPLFPSRDVLDRVYSTLRPVLVTLIEDHAKLTRVYAIRSLALLIRNARIMELIEPQHVNQIYAELIKRLDDVSDEVRNVSVRVIHQLFTMLPEEYDLNTNKSHLEYIFGSMIIHLGDENSEFQKALFNALKDIGTLAPQILLEKINMHKDNHANQILIKELEESILEKAFLTRP